MSDNIPFEIQTEIIKRVPDVKSLLRCRAVSKPLKSSIDSCDFIAGYGARDTQPHSLLVSYRVIENHCEIKYLTFTDDDNFTQQQDLAPNVTDFMKQFNDLEVVGSSHGLLCLYSYTKRMFVLWNPSIRKSVGIISPSYVYTCDDFGFTVCPVTNDPTIVKISNCPWKVEMFTLSSKRWSVVECRKVPPRECAKLGGPHVVIDRRIYWTAFEIVAVIVGCRFDHTIISFDLVAKEFRVVDVPNNLANPFPIAFSISKLRESLVLFVPDVGAEIPACGVWKMEDDGSFTKLFAFDTPNSSILKVFGFRKNDEPVMETRKEGEYGFALEVYEPCSERIKNLGIYGDDATLFMASYKETLLLLDHSDCCVYPDMN